MHGHVLLLSYIHLCIFVYVTIYFYFYTDASQLDIVNVSNEFILAEFTMTEIENKYKYLHNVLIKKQMLIFQNGKSEISINEDNDA